MILNPGILSLIIGSVIVVMMIFHASVLGLRVLEKWDIRSSSAEQLSLERETYLVSTVMNYAIGFLILSALLFIYSADDIHRLFVGAMCATGSLNANPIGWRVLYFKIIILFIASAWIALNYIDRQAEDYPLVRTKYTLLILLAPLVTVDAYLQIEYFLGLQPNIIVSCCGSLFSEGEEGIASSLSSFPAGPMMIVFYSTAGLLLLNAFLSLRFKKWFFKFASVILSPIFFGVAIASIISFISLYFYEMPTHHCPFDILQKDYNFVGYPLYITLFGGTFFSGISGVLEPFKKIPSLTEVIDKAQKRWMLISIVLILIFLAISSWPLIFSDFKL